MIINRSLLLLVKIATLKVWPWKVRLRLLSTTFAMVPFDGIAVTLWKSYLSIFCELSPFLRYSHFKIRDLENVDQGHVVKHSQWYHSLANTYLMAIVMFGQSLTICEIFPNQEKNAKSFTLKMKVKVMK